MKKENIIIGIIVLTVIVILGVLFINFNKNETTESTIKNSKDMIKMVNSIYQNINNELPSLETMTIDINNLDDVTSYTGLKSNKDIEELVISVPMMNAQAYSLAVVKVKDGANIESLKQEMLDNIDMRRWICVSAEKLYITNNGNIIFLVMSDKDTAKIVYDEFKSYVNNKVGKELEKTNEEENIELPPEMPATPVE